MDGYGKRVLVADDDEDLGFLMSMTLEQAGYNVILVRDGLDALVELKKRRFDVVVTDYSMPAMNGVELMKHIRTAVPEIPVILVSCTLPDVSAIDEPIKPFACLRKPYDQSVFLNLVHLAIDWQKHHGREDVPVAHAWG